MLSQYYCEVPALLHGDPNQLVSICILVYEPCFTSYIKQLWQKPDPELGRIGPDSRASEPACSRIRGKQHVNNLQESEN